MTDSILDTIKTSIGPSASDDFDPDILFWINSAIGTLVQLGVPRPSGFTVTDAQQTWAEYLGDDPRIDMIKTYIYLKTKIGFDPSTSSVLMQALKEQLAEYEWRITNPSEEG